jgi:hypothetical protein
MIQILSIILVMVQSLSVIVLSDTNHTIAYIIILIYTLIPATCCSTYASVVPCRAGNTPLRHLGCAAFPKAIHNKKSPISPCHTLGSIPVHSVPADSRDRRPSWEVSRYSIYYGRSHSGIRLALWVTVPIPLGLTLLITYIQ